MILNTPVVEVGSLPADTDLVSELRRFNGRDHDQAHGWIIQTEVIGDDEVTFPSLIVALHGSKAAIYYVNGGILRVPATGEGDGLPWVHVGKEAAKPKRTLPGSEVPPETVYQAIGEFLREPEPPASLKWVAPKLVVAQP
ncbi:hypothetical protein ACFORO_42695 [Amycolatopsis halotolerans]|uniref:Immunity protein Imm1 n=1 Tax=Amycolatopsis halotolerans TaxID=330083 RepID=A0ABV7QYC8_9PSEU